MIPEDCVRILCGICSPSLSASHPFLLPSPLSSSSRLRPPLLLKADTVFSLSASSRFSSHSNAYFLPPRILPAVAAVHRPCCVALSIPPFPSPSLACTIRLLVSSRVVPPQSPCPWRACVLFCAAISATPDTSRTPFYFPRPSIHCCCMTPVCVPIISCRLP